MPFISVRPPDSTRMTSRIQRSGTSYFCDASWTYGPHGSLLDPGAEYERCACCSYCDASCDAVIC